MTFICNTDDNDEWADLEADVETQEWDWDRYRRTFDRISDEVDDWQGTPVYLTGHRLRLNDRHPLREAYRDISDAELGPELDIIVGGPSDGAIDPDADPVELVGQALERAEDEEIVNHWFAAKLNCDVFIFRRRSTGRSFAVRAPRSPDRSMDRLDLWMMTLGASDAWDMAAEHKAREKLRGLLTDRQWRHYDLTGSFLETSPRSDLVYVFRRLRPTIALTPRWPWHKTQHDRMRCLAVLCMHPIGYYDRSWAGCLVPSDDVIAHLLFCRADEAGYWRVANQHDARQPEAGL